MGTPASGAGAPSAATSRIIPVAAAGAPARGCDGCDQDPFTAPAHYGTCPLAPLDRGEWDVLPWDKREAGDFISRWHYSGSANSRCVYAFGLIRRASPSELLGVALFSASLPKSAAEFFAKDWRSVLCLSRLALHPDVPTNGASFTIGRCVRQVRSAGRYRVLASYADTWQGHTGAIYRAANWEYLGTTTPSPVWVSPEGVVKPDHVNGRRRSMDGMILLGRFPKHRYRLALRTGARMES